MKKKFIKIVEADGEYDTWSSEQIKSDDDVFVAVSELKRDLLKALDSLNNCDGITIGEKQYEFGKETHNEYSVAVSFAIQLLHRKLEELETKDND